MPISRAAKPSVGSCLSLDNARYLPEGASDVRSDALEVVMESRRCVKLSDSTYHA